MKSNIVELTEANFETEVLQAAMPVVADFYAPWCGPCKMIAPRACVMDTACELAQTNPKPDEIWRL